MAYEYNRLELLEYVNETIEEKIRQYNKQTQDLRNYPCFINIDDAFDIGLLEESKFFRRASPEEQTKMLERKEYYGRKPPSVTM